jgi:surfeit locus 1 family protein
MPNPQSLSGVTPARPAPRRRPRFAPTLATIGAVAVFVAAGNWQGERMRAKEALRAQSDAALGAEPLPLASLSSGSDWAALRFRPVVATGAFIPSRQVLIDNRVHEGRAGYHVVTPMTIADGRVVLVNRGWIAQGASRSSLPAAAPPAGRVTVQGRLATPVAGYFELGRDVPAGPVWQNLDPARLGAAAGVDYLPVVVEATSVSPPDEGVVRDWPPPDFGIDKHRIYMIQWYAFAALAGGLWLWFNRPRSMRGNDA